MSQCPGLDTGFRCLGWGSGHMWGSWSTAFCSSPGSCCSCTCSVGLLFPPETCRPGLWVPSERIVSSAQTSSLSTPYWYVPHWALITERDPFNIRFRASWTPRISWSTRYVGKWAISNFSSSFFPQETWSECLGFQSLDPYPTQCTDIQCPGHKETCCTFWVIPQEPSLPKCCHRGWWPPQRLVTTTEEQLWLCILTATPPEKLRDYLQ